MKKKTCVFWGLGIILMVIPVFFAGCAEITFSASPLPNTPEIIDAHPLGAVTPIFTQLPPTNVITPSLDVPQGRLINDFPDICVPLGVSPDTIWVIGTCGGKLEALKANEPPVILFENAGGSVDFSPDGKKITLLIDRFDDGERRFYIWVYNIGEWHNPTLLLSYLSEMRGSGIKWAPDSQSIAVSYLENGYALSILSLDGTYKNLLTYEDVQREEGDGQELFGPTWSPDGKKIAYVNADFLDEHPVQLRTVEIATGKKELLYSGKPEEAGVKPIWSPDGEKIAFSCSMKKACPVYIYNIKNQTISSIGNFHLGSQLVWSPDGKYLAGFNGWLYVINTETNQLTDFQLSCSRFYGWDGNNEVIVEINSAIYSIPFP